MSLVDDAREVVDHLQDDDSVDMIMRLADRIVELEGEVDALQERHRSILNELYGQGFEVLGWHQNGDSEPLDSWFEDNAWVE